MFLRNFCDVWEGVFSTTVVVFVGCVWCSVVSGFVVGVLFRVVRFSE